ncbi:aminoglycoside 6'-N-acetyltransferase [Fodinibius roseus]|uniref:Aminoglycoside 6'-N-acetyltransferase n=1 Tax=Fodinibius roseus TaxID=1194090 RepID=A0A1M4YZ79_9BACT|nr:GNAT family N-acetyltransferase [Fodinibius roseus]SHF10812.1 aminoglycoside 6'-N-acetyltransferase [Fodinibius roseus]
MSQLSPNISLRIATPDDQALLEHWDKQPHVEAAAPNDDLDWEQELNRKSKWEERFIAELNGRPIGFLQIIDAAREETHYWGETEEGHKAIDIWIGEADDLGRGYGTEMMKLALDRCFSDPEVKAVLIDPLESNTKAHKFYRRLGFQFVERRRFGEDDCLVFRLYRDIGILQL